MRDITILLLTSVCVEKYGGIIIDLNDLDEETRELLLGERDPLMPVRFRLEQLRDSGFHGAIDLPPARLAPEPFVLPEDRPSWAFPRDTYQKHRLHRSPQHLLVRRGCRHK